MIKPPPPPSPVPAIFTDLAEARRAVNQAPPPQSSPPLNPNAQSESSPSGDPNPEPGL